MNNLFGLKGIVSFLGHRGRELLVWPRILPHLVKRSTAPSVAFLPSSTREGASLLRAWTIAEALTARGWNAITLPPQLEAIQRHRILRAFKPDLLVFQQCRHELNDPALTQGYRHVLDIDDADFHDPAMEDRLIRTCQSAEGVIAGSRYIKEWCVQHNPNVQVIWTGTPITRGLRPPHAKRQPIVAWAQSAPLGYHMELDFVVELDRCLRRAGAVYILRLYGVNTDEERRALLNRFPPGARIEMLPTLEYMDFLISLRDVAVGLSPIVAQSLFSRGKSFGKVLGYLDAGVPVVASDEADHELFFDESSGVISNDINFWTAEILRLLPDPEAREAMAEQATKAMQAHLTTAAAANQVDAFLRRLT